MSVLKTYDRPVSLQGEQMAWPFTIVGHEEGYYSYAPGEWVTHDTMGGTGMIIAITDEQLTVLWSVEPSALGPFTNMAFPLVRRMFSPQILPQLVQVQPMTPPSSTIFYMDYSYGKWDKRCNTGPVWSRLFWRACQWTSMKTQSLWSALRTRLSSLFAKKLANNDNVNPDANRRLLGNVLTKDEAAVKALIEKWEKVLPPADPGP